MERVTLRLFIISILVYAGTVIMLLWLPTESVDHLFKLFKFAATSLVVGFASFLLWMTAIVYRFLGKL